MRQLHLIPCACNCGVLILDRDDNGRPHRYIHGHNHAGRRFAPGERSGPRHHNWKGDKVGSVALHQWIRTYLPIPAFCEICKTVPPPLHLANVTGVYNREFNNWKYLCAKCHFHFDLESHKHFIHSKRGPDRKRRKAFHRLDDCKRILTKRILEAVSAKGELD